MASIGTPTNFLRSTSAIPVATGISGLGAGVATFLATPSGANLAAALTTALPASKGGTGVTALGTGVATALGQNVTGSGSPVLATSPTIATPTFTGIASGVNLLLSGYQLNGTSTNGVGVGYNFPSFLDVVGSSARLGMGTNITGIDTALTRGAAGVWSLEGASSVGGTFRAVPNAQAQFTANQDNLAVTTRSCFQRWTSDASRDVTGIVAGQNGEMHVIINAGANNIVLKHDVTSTAANRFLNSTGADITLAANEAADIMYDTTSSRWRVWKR